MKLGKPLLVSLSLALAGTVLGQGEFRQTAGHQRISGAPAQILAAFRTETVEGILFLGVPGDEALWAQVIPYLAENRASAYTPVCPRSKPKNARLFKLPNPGQGILVVLRTRSAAVLATGTPQRLEGVVSPPDAYALYKRQLNLEALEAAADQVFARCP